MWGKLQGGSSSGLHIHKGRPGGRPKETQTVPSGGHWTDTVLQVGGPLPSPAIVWAPSGEQLHFRPVSAEVSPRGELTAPVLGSHGPPDHRRLGACLLVSTFACWTRRRWTPKPDIPPPRGQVSGGQPSTTAQRSGLEAPLPPRPHRVRTDAETGPRPGAAPPQQGAPQPTRPRHQLPKQGHLLPRRPRQPPAS